MTARVELEKTICGPGPQGAWRQDQLIGGKPPVVKQLWLRLWQRGFSCCELLVWEADSWGQGQFGNPEEGERPPLKVATKQRLGKSNRRRRRGVFYSDFWSA
jgi:hypothetical protein